MGPGAGSSDNVGHSPVWGAVRSCGGKTGKVARGLEIRALDGVGTRSLAGFGCGSLCRGPLRLDSRMGTDQGIYPWVSTLVMGNLMGRRFWVGRGCFFLGGPRVVETFS